MRITVETTVAAPVEEVWRAWTTPDDIKHWNAASDDWYTTAATVDLRVGGAFSSHMEAKDGSLGFGFAGTYTKVVPHHLIEMAFDGRVAAIEFIDKGGSIVVRETFDAEETHPVEQQRQGWQAILSRFARYVEKRQYNVASPCAAANGGGPSWLQSARFSAGVAELEVLIHEPAVVRPAQVAEFLRA
jgi:uncharacterized protein YndB with AHSA1/START domain